MQFPQGRMNVKRISQRCKYCGKYPTNKEGKGVKMKYHLLICKEKPDDE